MSKALYRKYRSTSLDEVVGQEHITKLLARALETGKVAHAYLFTGPRGVGKTSIARIMAYEINKLPYDERAQNLDIIEIDAASNNGVEDVRDLREKVQIAPVSAAKKVYIIDEVHMLSKPAFNALLKTLEEPPEHIVFILATTDVNKLPATIISRTQHYGFRTIAPQVAAAHLRHIADAEKIAIEDDALLMIAERGGGSFRDSISLLDQLSSLQADTHPITAAVIEQTLGLASADQLETLLHAHQSADLKTLSDQLATSVQQGTSPVILAGQLISHVRTKIITHPELLPLLDALLDVPKSSHPELKLLSVLGSTAAPVAAVPSHPPISEPGQKAKNIALAAPVREVSASVASLQQSTASKKPEKQAIPEQKKEATKKVSTSAPRAAATAEFNWMELLQYVKEHHVALHSVLSKCTPEQNGLELTLYTGSAFFKKKLDDTKYSTSLHESIQTLGMPEMEITIVPDRAPLKDSQASAIADIMGGGVEVAV